MTLKIDASGIQNFANDGSLVHLQKNILWYEWMFLDGNLDGMNGYEYFYDLNSVFSFENDVIFSV